VDSDKTYNFQNYVKLPQQAQVKNALVTSSVEGKDSCT